MTTGFDRWTALIAMALGTVLWVVFPILRGRGLLEDGSWRALAGVIAIAVGWLSVIQAVRQRRERDVAAELHLNARDIP